MGGVMERLWNSAAGAVSEPWRQWRLSPAAAILARHSGLFDRRRNPSNSQWGGVTASMHSRRPRPPRALHRRFHRMKLRLIAVAVAALALIAGNAVAQDTSSEKGKLSYALGYDLGRNASESGEQVDVEYHRQRPAGRLGEEAAGGAGRPAAHGRAEHAEAPAGQGEGRVRQGRRHQQDQERWLPRQQQGQGRREVPARAACSTA